MNCIVGTAGVLKRRRLRKFINEQKAAMFMLKISVEEKKGLFSSLFRIKVSGRGDMVDYWCNTVKLYLDRL